MGIKYIKTACLYQLVRASWPSGQFLYPSSVLAKTERSDNFLWITDSCIRCIALGNWWPALHASLLMLLCQWLHGWHDLQCSRKEQEHQYPPFLLNIIATTAANFLNMQGPTGSTTCSGNACARGQDEVPSMPIGLIPLAVCDINLLAHA